MIYDIDEPWLPGMEPNPTEKLIMRYRLQKEQKTKKKSLKQRKDLLKMDPHKAKIKGLEEF